jgi:hypothetical protein
MTGVCAFQIPVAKQYSIAFRAIGGLELEEVHQVKMRVNGHCETDVAHGIVVDRPSAEMKLSNLLYGSCVHPLVDLVSGRIYLDLENVICNIVGRKINAPHLEQFLKDLRW